jgi:hypothetical protein
VSSAATAAPAYHVPPKYDLAGVYPHTWWSAEATPSRVNKVVEALRRPGEYFIRNDGVIVEVPRDVNYKYLTISGGPYRRADAMKRLKMLMDILRP